MSAATAIRFLFVTGKGGVGKTTVAAALALGFSRLGRKTLVVAGSGTSQLGRALATNVTTRPAEVAPGLHAALIDPEEAMREYVESAVGSKLVTDALFHQKFSGGFLHGIPGLRAWALLGKAWHYGNRSDSGPALVGAPYDIVILDAPATGDSTDLLRVPRIITELAPFGRLKKDAEDCWAMLTDPRQSAIVAVTLPEELPVTETTELIAVVRKDLGLPLGPLVVNQCSPPLLSLEARHKLARASVEDDDPAVRSALLSGQRRALREESEEQEVSRLSALGLELCRVPRLAQRPSGISGLAEVLEHLQGPFGFDRSAPG